FYKGMEEMDLFERIRRTETRREFLVRSAQGLGMTALACLLNGGKIISSGTAAGLDNWRGVIHPPHFVPKARRIIYLYMAGGPSHLETFDYKPKLVEMDGKPMPESLTRGKQMSTMTSGQRLVVMRPQYAFERFGESGQEICTLFPH